MPVVGWIALRTRCASCGRRISARYPVIEVTAGLAFAGVTWWSLVTYGPTSSGWTGIATVAVILAFWYLASISIVLAVIDVDVRRLPNSIVLPSYVVGAVLLTVASLLLGDAGALVRAGIGMALLYVFYFALRFARPGGMGGGDVKLAGVLGLYLGWVGWGALAVGALAAFVIGGLWGVALILTRRAGRKTAIPFGPWMILGAWVGVFAGNSIGRWYLGLLVGA